MDENNTDTDKPKYLKEALSRFGPTAKPGAVTHVTVMHDDWCPMLSGKGKCCCDFVLVPGAPPTGGQN